MRELIERSCVNSCDSVPRKEEYVYTVRLKRGATSDGERI